MILNRGIHYHLLSLSSLLSSPYSGVFLFICILDIFVLIIVGGIDFSSIGLFFRIDFGGVLLLMSFLCFCLDPSVLGGGIVVLLGIFVQSEILIYLIILGFVFSIFVGGYIPYIKFKETKLFFVGPFLTVLLYFAHVSGVLTGMFQRIYKKTED